jgi:hypothetical protein
MIKQSGEFMVFYTQDVSSPMPGIDLAVYLADRFNKPLIISGNCYEGNNPGMEFQNQKNGLSPFRQENFETIRDEIFLMVQIREKKWGIMDSDRIQLARMIGMARYPIMLARSGIPSLASIKRIDVPVDRYRESKELIFWAAAFGKHLKKTIRLNLIWPEMKEHRKMVNSNAYYAGKVLDGLGVPFEVSGTAAAENPHAIRKERDYSIKMIIVRKKRFLISRYYQLPFEKMMNDRPDLPFIIIPAREDLYLPCI